MIWGLEAASRSGSWSGWWWAGGLFMVVCMVMMMRMMGGMMGHGRSGHGGRGSTDDPERTLADRLARGEIEIDEYNQRLDALRGARSSSST
jgi:uncharacterized membrane protein